MDAFIFTQRYNSPGSAFMTGLGNPTECSAVGRRIAGVAPTHACDGINFFEAAQRLKRIHDIPQPIFQYDNGEHDEVPKHRRRFSILAALAQVPDRSLDLIAYFGHGTRGGLETAGVDQTAIIQFKDLIERKCRPNATVVFYACLTGAPRGFAEKLAGLIDPALNIWVYGHVGPGHYAHLGMFRKFPGATRLSRTYESRLCMSFGGTNAQRKQVELPPSDPLGLF